MKTFWLPLFTLLIITACSSENNQAQGQTPNAEPMYFPDNNSTNWETKTTSSLGWEQSNIEPLLNFLNDKHTKSFIILVNGRIIIENYFDGHSATSPWYWASAGKTLTAATVGIAQQQGYISINNKVSDYLGNGWTSAPLVKENLINCKHLLTMTSGIDDSKGDGVSPANLQYLTDAGTRWAYSNVYVKLQDAVANATQQTWSNYFDSVLKNKIGMTGAWIATGNDLSVYYSTARSMARFGLLMLNEGKWKEEQIINTTYWNEMTTTSQNLNKSYGYLWWLNGKESFRLPQTQQEFAGSIIAPAPNDMYMALGKNDQKIYVIPSRKMVIIRMGNAADEENFALSGFDTQLWQKINAVIN